MNIVVWIILAFTLLQFIIALTNLLFRPKYRLREKEQNELVSVLIPARNEAKNIGSILNDLMRQSYSRLEIIVFNDESTDQTKKIVKLLSRSDSRIRLINSTGLPEGWLGKNNACHVLGKEAKGNYLLYLDADVNLGKNTISKTVDYLRKHKLSLLSVFPKQQMKSFGERITVPNMNFILLTLLPLVLVEKTSKPSLAAANGQFMLFNSKSYKEFQPHEKLKASKVEDIEISQLFKKNGLQVACHACFSEISCRMYNSFVEAVNGFSKNVIMFFGNSAILALLFWLITTFGFLVILLAKTLMFFFGYLLVVVLTRLLVSLTSNQNVLFNIVLFPMQQLTMGVFIFQSMINRYRKNYVWKGRRITY